MNSYTREFDRQMDERVVSCGAKASSKSSAICCRSTPTLLRRRQYARHGDAAGDARLDKYDGKVEFITELFPSSGTGRLTLFSRFPRKDVLCRTLS